MSWEIGEDPVEEILGAEYLLGAAKRRAGGSRPLPPATLVQSQGFSKAREYALGFDGGTVASTASVSVTTRPQVTFRPDRLSIPQTIAPSFLLTDLRVGKDSQFVSGTAIPAEVFASGSVGVGLKMDTAQVGVDITINATSIALASLRFFGALLGPAVM